MMKKAIFGQGGVSKINVIDFSIKTKVLFILFFYGIILSSSDLAWAQQRGGEGSGHYDSLALLKIFIEGDQIDPAYLIKEIPYVNFVRDPKLSDVQILITWVGTASGGRDYRLNYLGKEEFSDITFELKHTSYQEETYHMRRTKLVNILRMGLTPYISQTSGKDQLTMNYDMRGRRSANAATDENDPWNYWVFEISGNGSYYKEESYNSMSLNGSIEIDKITEEWKLTNDLYVSRWKSNYKDDDEWIESTNSYESFSSSLVKSISRRWSSGLSGNVNSSTYRNIHFAYSIAPAVEYNIFPWEEVDRREFTIAYRVGFVNNNYMEETIYGKIEEMLAYESLSINFRMIQPWGDINTHLSGSHYFHDIAFYSTRFSTSFDIRITRNLAFNIHFRAESIHDQIYLPAGELTLEEILTRQKSLATTYEYSMGAGLRLRFGSIYSNVVNRRL